jgi:hypothetical protein
MRLEFMFLFMVIHDPNSPGRNICEAYIVENISAFISYYFEPHLKTRINCVPRHDDSGEVPPDENLLIFSHPR